MPSAHFSTAPKRNKLELPHGMPEPDERETLQDMAAGMRETLGQHRETDDFGLDPEEELAREQKHLRDTFTLTLLAKRKEAIKGRATSGIEEEWTEDEEHYQGIDDANRAYQNANMLYRSRKSALLGNGNPRQNQPTRSIVFLNITRPYVDAASARVADMLLPTDDRSWEIKPTPIPKLSGLQLTKLAEALGLQDPVQVQVVVEQERAKAKQGQCRSARNG